MRGSEYADLRAFATVVERGNFTRAAEQLQISPSTLSQIIRGLEARLGVRLLNRTTRSVSLTDAGRRLHARLLPAIADLESAVAGISGMRENPAGTLRVCFSRLSAELFLEPHLGRFHEAFPDILLDITLDDSYPDIVAGGYDVGVRVGEWIQKDMEAVRLGGTLEHLVVASPSYIKKNGAPETPADLQNHRCINWRQQWTDKLYEWAFQKKDGARFTVVVDGPLIVSDRSLAVAAARQGVGITMVPAPRARPWVDKGKLVSLLEPWSFSYTGWHVFYPRQRQTPATVRAFVDFITKQTAK